MTVLSEGFLAGVLGSRIARAIACGGVAPGCFVLRPRTWADLAEFVVAQDALVERARAVLGPGTPTIQLRWLAPDESLAET